MFALDISRTSISFFFVVLGACENKIIFLQNEFQRTFLVRLAPNLALFIQFLLIKIGSTVRFKLMNLIRGILSFQNNRFSSLLFSVYFIFSVLLISIAKYKTTHRGQRESSHQTLFQRHIQNDVKHLTFCKNDYPSNNFFCGTVIHYILSCSLFTHYFRSRRFYLYLSKYMFIFLYKDMFLSVNICLLLCINISLYLSKHWIAPKIHDLC